MIREITFVSQQYSLTPQKTTRSKIREGPPVKKVKTMNQESRKIRSRIFKEDKENFENESLPILDFLAMEEVQVVCRELNFNKQQLFKNKTRLKKRKAPNGNFGFAPDMWNPVKKLSIGSRD